MDFLQFRCFMPLAIAFNAVFTLSRLSVWGQLLITQCWLACCPGILYRLRNDLYCVGWGVKLYSI